MLQDSRGTGDGFANLLLSECLTKLKPEHAELMVMNIVRGMTTKGFQNRRQASKHYSDLAYKSKTQFYDCIEGRT